MPSRASRACGFQGVSEGLTLYRLRGSGPFPFEPLNLRWSDPGRPSRSPVQDSSGIDSARIFRRSNASARRAIFEFQEEDTLARFPVDCSQNGALMSNLRSACRLIQSAESYRSLYFVGSLGECAALFPSGPGRGIRLFRDPGAGTLPDRSRHLGGQFAPAEPPAALT